MPPTTDPRPLVAFDFDGTLAHDASSAWVEVEEILRSHGVDMESPKLRASLDRITSDRALVDACVAEVRRDEVYRSIVRLHLSRARSLELLPGVGEMLRELAERYVLAVYSGRDVESLDAALQALGIADLFAHVQGDCDTYPPKPDPAALRMLAARADIPVNCCVYVGDRITDAESAAAAGYHFIAAVWRTDRFPDAVKRCTRASDLAAAVDRLLAGDHALE